MNSKRKPAYMNQQRKYHRDRRKLLLANGLCPVCGKTAFVPGTRSCQPCADRQSKYAHERQQLLKETGLCTHCGKTEVTPGRKTCAPCRKKRKAYSVVRAEKQLSKGLCLSCTEPAAPGKQHCQHHLDQLIKINNKRVYARRAKGLCQRCGERPHRPNRRNCEDCANRERDYWNTARERTRTRRTTPASEPIACKTAPKARKASSKTHTRGGDSEETIRRKHKEQDDHANRVRKIASNSISLDDSLL